MAGDDVLALPSEKNQQLSTSSQTVILRTNRRHFGKCAGSEKRNFKADLPADPFIRSEI
jgi:hypothetical protein